MVLAVISEHLVGTRYYLFFFFLNTHSLHSLQQPYRSALLQRATLRQKPHRSQSWRPPPKSLTKVGDVSHRCHAAGVGRRAASKETQAPQ